MSTLFTPYNSKYLQLKNKVVMAPMTRSRATADTNEVTDMVAEYYHQRANAGLIITEGTSPSPNGLGYPRIPGIFNEGQKQAWAKVASAVHEKGSKLFIQLMHTGRVSHQDNLPAGSKVVAPSALLAPGEMYTDAHGPQPHTEPQEMTKEDISLAVAEYVKAAELAKEAGADGIELHAANGYLIEQFLNPNCNHRTDEYGGSMENRNRFAIEVAKATVEACGNEFVGIRLSPYGVFNGTGSFDDLDEQYGSLARALGKIGLAYIHLVDHSAMGAPEVPNRIKDIIRAEFGGTIILSGGYDKSRAENDLDTGKGDLIAFGRPFIANPDLVQRMKEGLALAEPIYDTFYTPGSKGYIDYPTASEKTQV